MKYGRYIIILGAAALSACSSNTVRDTLGLNVSAPDEFRVVSRPPLSIPPQFTLRPPDNSDAPVGQISAAQQAQALMLGGKPADGSSDVNTAVTPVKVSDKPAPKAKADKTSGAEEQFLKNAGADKADPNVREEIVEDHYAVEEKHDDCPWWDVTCTTPESKDPLVDAKKESDRIKTDEDSGKPVTTGDTATVKDRDTGLLGKILGY